jgi:hypothetical protein
MYCISVSSFGMPSRKKYESRKEIAAEGGIYYTLSWIGLVFLICGMLTQLIANFL